MKSFWKDSRAEIYLGAAKRIADGSSRFCCCAINLEAGISPQELIDAEQFPEFFLLAPTNHHNSLIAWFGDNEYISNQNRRVLALLFAHQMALNP